MPISLPKGYNFKMYDVGNEKYWAKLEYVIGDFSSIEEAEMYFKRNYFNQIDELKKRCVFVVDNSDDVVGSCIAWHDFENGDTVTSLHWLVVAPKHQGKHIGLALCQKVMAILINVVKLPYIFTHNRGVIRLYYSIPNPGLKFRKPILFHIMIINMF